jgi:glutamine amidotransferase
MKITVVDFGAGNLLSVCRALRHVGAEVALASAPGDIVNAERLVLPGVGAFGACMKGLIDLGLVEPLRAFAATGRPFLGICVGQQLLFDQSDEFGHSAGLGLIPGRVIAIPREDDHGRVRRIPHIGWNALMMPESRSDWTGTLLAGINTSESAYFLHSFISQPKNAGHSLAVCDYNGISIVAAVQHENLTGCQFHPEKSGEVGLRMLANFAISKP